MIEVNPWTSQELAEKAMQYRGAIVAAWGNIETWLSEVALRASHVDAYRGLRGQFPYKIETRIAFLEKILEQPGPLARFAPLGRPLLARVRQSAKLRNQMAHARMTMLPQWGVTFEELVGQGDQVSLRRRRYSLAELEALARRATRLSRIVQRAAARLEAEKVLPPLLSLTSLYPGEQP
jgi:hypothetical protein